MGDITEIRWHGRGGQGAVTAAKLVAEAALKQDKHFQASPEYGPERMGAPIQAFTRICDEPIEIFCGVTNPDIVVVLDPTLLAVVDVTDGVPESGTVIVNTSEDPASVREQTGFKSGTVATVDATQIAIDTIGKAIPNTPMLGALLKVTGMMDIDRVLEHVRASFGKKFAKEIIEGNVHAVRRAYEEVKIG